MQLTNNSRPPLIRLLARREFNKTPDTRNHVLSLVEPPMCYLIRTLLKLSIEMSFIGITSVCFTCVS